MNRVRSVLIAIGLFLLSKFKWVIGFLKFSKFGTTLISMGISLWAYALFYGWKFAAALVYLIFVHEMGHLVAAKIKGIRTSPAVFLPFVGAVIGMKEQPRDAKTEAFLAYGGPLAGLISFLPALPLYWTTGDPFWSLVIFLGAMINLFNLFPISPLDGGRIVSVLSPKIWFFGLLVLGVLLVFSPDPLLLFILIFGIISWWNHLNEGYQKQVLEYQKTKWQNFIQDVKTWALYTLTTEERYTLQRAAAQAANEQRKRGFTLPLVHEEKRLAYDQYQIDCRFTLMKWELLLQWEREPLAFVFDSTQTAGESEVLKAALHQAEKGLQETDEKLSRLKGYYQSSAKTKWIVLAAYIGLAVVLSVFFIYGNNLMQLHGDMLGR